MQRDRSSSRTYLIGRRSLASLRSAWATRMQIGVIVLVMARDLTSTRSPLKTRMLSSLTQQMQARGMVVRSWRIVLSSGPMSVRTFRSTLTASPFLSTACRALRMATWNYITLSTRRPATRIISWTSWSRVIIIMSVLRSLRTLPR